MDNLFFKMPCLSESQELKSKEIYEKLFDKKVDKRYLESAVQKFLLLNVYGNLKLGQMAH